MNGGTHIVVGPSVTRARRRQSELAKRSKGACTIRCATNDAHFRGIGPIGTTLHLLPGWAVDHDVRDEVVMLATMGADTVDEHGRPWNVLKRGGRT